MQLSEILIPRSSWGAAPPKAVDRDFTRDGGIVIHYSTRDGSKLTQHWPQCYDSWQAHQYYHMETKGWFDLAYNFGVCPHGFVFEGRGWEAQNGANRPENNRTLSICLDVDGDDLFDIAVVNAVNLIIEEAVNERGWAPILRPHKAVAQANDSDTPCPGPNVLALMEEGKIHLPTSTSPAPDPQPNNDTVTNTTAEDTIQVVHPPASVVPSLRQMQYWAQLKGGTPLFIRLAPVARREAIDLDINPGVLYAIMGHETGMGRFGGVLDESYRNWAGIKTPQGGDDYAASAHTRFPTHQIGVRAAAQHIAAYFGIDLLRDEIVDPRFFEIPAAIPGTELPADRWKWSSTPQAHAAKVVKFAYEMLGQPA